MELSEKPQFAQLLTGVLASYAKPLPEATILAAWWSNLQPYPLRIVAMAFAAYCDENDKFAPIPVGIAKCCKLMDGRPSAEEAWAIALTSRDENDTVVWTREIAAAFDICASVFPDEVGARMSFKDAYNRLVAAARGAGQPAQWSASIGWDVRKREASLAKASVAGLLSAPAVAGLLPHSAGAVHEDDNARAQLAKIREMMAAMNAEKQREIDLHAQRERDATAEAKRKSNEMVAQYKRDDAA